MRFFSLKANTGIYNHAMDMALLKHATQAALRLYTFNPPCVSISHKQHFSDANAAMCKELGVDVVRRQSRGHTDFLDKHTLCYTVVLTEHVPKHPHSHICAIVSDALKSAGIDTVRNGESDLLVDECMIGGSVMIQQPGRVLVHGKIRYALNKEMMSRVINYRGRPLSQYRDVLDRYMTCVSEHSGVSLGQFCTMLRDAFAQRFTLGNGVLSVEEHRELVSTMQHYADPQWIAGTGTEPNRGVCDLVREKKSLIDGFRF